MRPRVVFPLLAGWVTLHLAASAAALPFSFECITQNDPGDCAIGEAQLVMDVSAGPGPDQVSFKFQNIGPGTSTLAQIYFDDGSLILLSSIDNSPGVSFEFYADPPELPGAALANPPFVTTAGFLSGATLPPPTNGVENDLLGTEWVTLIFDLQAGQTLDDVIGELNDGTLRAGLHVINFDSGGSESFVSIPEPGSAALLMIGFAGLLAARRRRA